MAAFGGDLYVSTDNILGTQVWRTAGVGGPPYTDWEQVNENGFGDYGESCPSMAVWGSYLYVGTYNDIYSCQVWRTDGTGATPAWEQVNEDGFGEPYGCVKASSMAVYGNQLYVGTDESSGGCMVWRTSGAGGPPFTDWQQVNTSGFGSTSNTDAPSMAVYNGKLYAGTSNASGCQVWSYDGSSWSGAGSGGLGNASNLTACSLAGYNGKLYASTSNASGCEIRSSTGGTSWSLANTAGFGSAGNQQAWTLATNDFALLAGTYNAPAGCDVWLTGTFAGFSLYFAEGYTGAGFQEYLCLGQPGDAPWRSR